VNEGRDFMHGHGGEDGPHYHDLEFSTRD
jgi:hypothetical protein